MKAPPRVVQISFFKDPAARRGPQLLESWTTLVDVAEAARCSGVGVAVVQASVHTETLERNGVSYHFVPCDVAAPGGSAALDSVLTRIGPDVLHVHGLESAREVLALAP